MEKKLSFNSKYPLLYKAIYESYNFLNNEVLKPGKIIPLVGAVAIILYSYRNGTVALTAVISILTFLFLLTVRILLKWSIEYILRNVGSDYKFIFPGKHLIRKEYEPCSLILENIDSSKFEFATEEKAQICAEINHKAFARSAWETTLEDKFIRNLSHIKKNKLCIMLIKSFADDKFVGFTHIIPVSANTWYKYKAGKIGDNKFSDKLIVPDNPTKKDNQPYGLILFSVAIAGRNNDFKDPKTYISDVGDLLEQAMAFHVNTYMQTLFKEIETVPILFQNMSSSFLDFFEVCAISSSEISKDGASIVTFEVTNENETLNNRIQQSEPKDRTVLNAEEKLLLNNNDFSI